MEAFPAEATCTTHTPLLEPASFVSDSPYQLAKTWFLPDWQNDTRSYNTSSGSDDKAVETRGMMIIITKTMIIMSTVAVSTVFRKRARLIPHFIHVRLFGR